GDGCTRTNLRHLTAAPATRARRHRSGTAKRHARPAEPGCADPAVHRSWHVAQPALLFLRRAREAVTCWLVAPGNLARTRHLEDRCRREHAPECRWSA